MLNKSTSMVNGHIPNVAPFTRAVNPMTPRIGRNGKLKRQPRPVTGYTLYIMELKKDFPGLALTSLLKNAVRGWIIMSSIQKNMYVQQALQLNAKRAAAQVRQMSANSAQVSQIAATAHVAQHVAQVTAQGQALATTTPQADPATPQP